MEHLIPSMKGMYSIVVLGVAFYAATVYVLVDPQLFGLALAALTFLGLACALLVTTTLGLTRWRTNFRFWMSPALLCLTFVFASRFAPPLARLITDGEFMRHIDEYSAVVDGVKSGAISCDAPCSTRLRFIQGGRRPFGIASVKAARCANGGVVLVFLRNTQVPLLHEGYAFEGYEPNDSCVTSAMRPEKLWSYVRNVTGDWYHFSDEPGL
jgi:hypothetical protein